RAEVSAASAGAGSTAGYREQPARTRSEGRREEDARTDRRAVRRVGCRAVGAKQAFADPVMVVRPPGTGRLQCRCAECSKTRSVDASITDTRASRRKARDFIVPGFSFARITCW